MLLPSDVARLVLGYLQAEGLTSTSKAFIQESPNLKEYADHTTEDGTIPACVFSVFGKGLTTILNEYVAAKAKESCHEIPAMMTSLWKKLDFTLNQIKSLQNSPAISAYQRTRSRVGLANMTRQRVLTVSSTSAVVCTPVSETSSIISPANTSQSMLGHSTPVSYSLPHTRPAISNGPHQQIQDVSRLLQMPRDSPVQIIVSENRLNPGPMSPGRRKWDTPRKRSGAPSGSSGPGRSAVSASSHSAESQPEEANENFPQLVIQNARDKILGDRSLQEKLAENINKILASDPTPQTPKPSSSTMEADQSIDEILGLQGEIHMSDDAIHDILEQTESDPAFQALFDLFEYNKTKFPDAEQEEENVSSNPENCDIPVPSAALRPLQSDEPVQKDANYLDSTPVSAKMKASDQKERKTRKSTGPTMLKKTVLGPSSRTSRIENSSARLLVIQGQQGAVSSAAESASRKAKGSLVSDSVLETPMDIDEPLNTPPPPLDIIATQEPAIKDRVLTTAVSIDKTTVPSPNTGRLPQLEGTSTSIVDKKQEVNQAQGSKEQLAAASSSDPNNPPAIFSPVQVEINNISMLTANLPHKLISSEGDTQSVFTPSSFESASSTSTPNRATTTSVCALPSSASTNLSLTTTPGSTASALAATTTVRPASATPASPASSSSCTPLIAAPYPPLNNQAMQSKSAADSNIVSLKIIISDNQEEHSANDAVLNQAISSIPSEKIPTIYLSSPAKSPAGTGTTKANLDEAALAVSGLQSSEGHASPLSVKAGPVVASSLSGAPTAQPNYIIQLPLDTANPALQGATTSYFLVTEPPATDAQARQVILPAGASRGQSLPINQYGVDIQTCSQTFSTGPALILPSPVKPVMLPVSVVGQNTLGNVQRVSNQIVAIPNPLPVQHSETVKPKHPILACKPSTTAETEKNLLGKLVQPMSSEITGLQDKTKGPKHRRILCFESSAEIPTQMAKTTLPTTTILPLSQAVQHTEKDRQHPATRAKPNIIGGNKPKRRVQPVRCSTDLQTGRGFEKKAETVIPSEQQQKDPVRKNSGKSDNRNTQESQTASPSRKDGSHSEHLKKSESESGAKSQSIDKKHCRDRDNEGVTARDPQKTRSLSSDATLKSGTRKEKDDSSNKEPGEKTPIKSAEGNAEKKSLTQEMPNVTANKENEIKGSVQEQSTASPLAERALSSAAVTQATSNPQSKAIKAPSKTSSLAKQAAEMLLDIQGLNSPSTPIKRHGAGTSDLSLPCTPKTGLNEEQFPDCVQSSSQQRKSKDREGTPKHLMPPNNSEVPNCSPASETGSEKSINMAAHTLMILSRAAIARTGTPLKDSLRQEGMGQKSPTSSKKRKQSSPTVSPPAKKDRERKKLMDCFPQDLDVDKFLSSLHYDE